MQNSHQKWWFFVDFFNIISQMNIERGIYTELEQKRGIESLTVVIPALNEEAYIPRLLTSLTWQDFKGDFQVIVVDGNSQDRTVEVAKSFQNRLPIEIIQSERGVGRQRNVGAENSKYSHIAFMDSDIILPRGFLNKLAGRVNPDERIIDTVSLLPVPRKFIDTMAAMYGNAAFAFINKFIEPVMIGPFMFTTRENHEKIGGFAEGSVIGEDLDYALRSVKDGAKNHMHPDLYVFNSSRRADMMGRINFTKTWARAYFHVRKNGPIYENFDYSFGDYIKK